MTKTPEIREELAKERQELKDAVAELRGELDEKTKRGKQLAVKVGATAGVAMLARVVLKLKRR